MTAPAIPLANMTSVCSDCGAVFWTADGHSCSGRAEGQCPGCSVLQRQIDELARQVESLDRGVAEAGTTASRALAAAGTLKNRADAQDSLWSLYQEGKAAASRGTPPPRRPLRGRRPRSEPLTPRPSLTALPGGAA
jgi:hypothetical protein